MSESNKESNPKEISTLAPEDSEETIWKSVQSFMGRPGTINPIKKVYVEYAISLLNYKLQEKILKKQNEYNKKNLENQEKLLREQNKSSVKMISLTAIMAVAAILSAVVTAFFSLRQLDNSSKQLDVIQKELNLEMSRYGIEFFPKLEARLSDNQIVFVKNTGQVPLHSVRVGYFYGPVGALYTKELDTIDPGEEFPFEIVEPKDGLEVFQGLVVAKILYAKEPFDEKYTQGLYDFQLVLWFTGERFVELAQ